MAPLRPPAGGSRRASGVRMRLVGLVLIPSLGLGALVAGEVADRRVGAAEADALVARVNQVTAALDGFVAASDELRATGIMLQPRRRGVDRAQVRELIGFDIVDNLHEARRAVDESPALAPIIDDLGGRDALEDARAAADRGDPLPNLFNELVRRSLAASDATIDDLTSVDAELHAPGALHQSMDSLTDAANVFRFTQFQIVAAAASFAPGVFTISEAIPDMGELAASVRAATADLLTSADEHLAEVVTGLTSDDGFDEAVAVLSRDAVGEAFDVAALAPAFRQLMSRTATVSDIAAVAAEDAKQHAMDAGAAARSAYERSIGMLVVIVLTSIALSILVARSITRPLQRLERRAAAISEGELDGDPLPESGPREAAVLARTLNDAVASLRRVEQQATALARGDVEAASQAASHGKLSALLQRSVDGLASSLRERDRLQERLRYDADHDGLTALANRRAAITALDAMLAEPGPRTAVLFFDVDGLKIVNDTDGHAAGDALLRATATKLREVAPSDALVARLGGDEFVLATRLGDAGVATSLADHLVVQLSDTLANGASVPASVSVGVALAAPGERADDILRWADVALYEAKHRGRGRAVLLDDELRAEVHRSQRIDDELRTALRDDALELHYQPIVDVLRGSVAAVEALVRWRRPDGELVPPDRFIPVAERTGTIVDLDHWVLRTATARAAEWRRGPLPDLRLAINVSARTLLSPTLVDAVDEALLAAGLDADALELEVTETALLTDLDAAARRLAALRERGVMASIDDFGTGYTSVSQLRRLPVSQVKIDRSFVAAIGDDRDRVLVDLVIRIGQVLGVEVVAEGVETESQLEALRSLGLELAQGYLFSCPVADEELVAAVVAIGRAADAAPAALPASPAR